MDLSIIFYIWTIILTLAIVLIWIKVEVVADRVQQQSGYQEMRNNINDQDFKYIRGQILEIKKQQGKQRPTESTTLVEPISRRETLNSEEMVYNAFFLGREEIFEDDYEDAECEISNELEELQEIGSPRAKL